MSVSSSLLVSVSLVRSWYCCQNLEASKRGVAVDVTCVVLTGTCSATATEGRIDAVAVDVVYARARTSHARVGSGIE